MMSKKPGLRQKMSEAEAREMNSGGVSRAVLWADRLVDELRRRRMMRSTIVSIASPSRFRADGEISSAGDMRRRAEAVKRSCVSRPADPH